MPRKKTKQNPNSSPKPKQKTNPKFNLCTYIKGFCWEGRLILRMTSLSHLSLYVHVLVEFLEAKHFSVFSWLHDSWYTCILLWCMILLSFLQCKESGMFSIILKMVFICLCMNFAKKKKKKFLCCFSFTFWVHLKFAICSDPNKLFSAPLKEINFPAHQHLLYCRKCYRGLECDLLQLLFGGSWFRMFASCHGLLAMSKPL